MTILELATQAQDFSRANLETANDKLDAVDLALVCDPDSGYWAPGLPVLQVEEWASKVATLSDSQLGDLTDEMERLGHIKPSRLIRTS